MESSCLCVLAESPGLSLRRRPAPVAREVYKEDFAAQLSVLIEDSGL